MENSTVFLSDVNRERLRNWGYRDAANHTGDPGGLRNCLGAVVSEYMKGTKTREGEVKKKIEDLVTENDKLRNTNESITNSDIKPKEEEIKRIRLELMDVELKPEVGEEKGKLESDFSLIGFSIGSVLLVFLSVYLFIFYSSSVHSAFIKNLGEMLQSSSLTEDVSILFNTIFDPRALTDARHSGAAALIMTILSPALFIAMGLLLHVMSTKKRYQAYRYLRIGALLAFVFFADAVIAYKITQGIYDAKLLAGLVENKWTFSMVWQDVNFYLVLIAGFAGYIVWGVLLGYVTEEFQAMKYLQAYKRKREHMIDTLTAEIKKVADVVLSNKNKISDNEMEIKHCSNMIDSKIVDTGELGSTIDTYVSGWTEFVNGLHQGPDEGKDDPIIEEIVRHKDAYIRDITTAMDPTGKATTKFVQSL